MITLPSVLLIDDDYTTNLLNTMLLQYLDPGVQVRTALNGREGLDLLHRCGPPPASSYPGLILLDLNMPIMDGFEFLEAYRHLPEAQRQGMVVVVLTTSSSSRDLARLQGLPSVGFLAKPLTEEKLAQVLADYFPPSLAAGSL